MLPDDVLLEIFDFYVDQGQGSKEEIRSWQLLIQVCRRWRIIIFGSPCRLNLRLFCTPKTPVHDTLAVWPALPFSIQGNITSMSDAANTIAMLNYSDRMRMIDFKISGSQFSYISAAMQKPFPELTHLLLDTFYNECTPTLTDFFLGGSAPRLQVLSLSCVTFLGLPRLLLSTTHLVSLYLKLDAYPYHERVPSEVMVTTFPALTRLEMLEIDFSRYSVFTLMDGRPPPPTHSVLPALTRFTFRGNGRDFEILAAQLDTPLLNRLSVYFSDPAHIHMYTTQVAQFIGHAPSFRANDEANIVFYDNAFTVKLASRAIGHEGPVVSIQSTGLLSTLAHICTSSFSPLSTLERLCIYEIGPVGARWKREMANPQWLGIFRSFAAVKNLYISQVLAPEIMSSLGRGMAEVLPNLQNVFIEGLQLSRPVRELFVARQLSGNSINVSHWNRLEDQEQDIVQ